MRGGVIAGFYGIWNVHVTSAYAIASTSHQEAYYDHLSAVVLWQLLMKLNLHTLSSEKNPLMLFFHQELAMAVLW